MKVTIEFDLDTYSDDTPVDLHGVLGDLTHSLRSSRRIRPGSWKINYDVRER